MPKVPVPVLFSSLQVLTRGGLDTAIEVDSEDASEPDVPAEAPVILHHPRSTRKRKLAISGPSRHDAPQIPPKALEGSPKDSELPPKSSQVPSKVSSQAPPEDSEFSPKDVPIPPKFEPDVKDEEGEDGEVFRTPPESPTIPMSGPVLPSQPSHSTPISTQDANLPSGPPRSPSSWFTFKSQRTSESPGAAEQQPTPSPAPKP